MVLPRGSGPRHLAQHPGGNVFVVTEYSAEVAVAVLSPGTGDFRLGFVGPATAGGALPGDSAAEIALAAGGGTPTWASAARTGSACWRWRPEARRCARWPMYPAAATGPGTTWCATGCCTSPTNAPATSSRFPWTRNQGCRASPRTGCTWPHPQRWCRPGPESQRQIEGLTPAWPRSRPFSWKPPSSWKPQAQRHTAGSAKDGSAGPNEYEDMAPGSGERHSMGAPQCCGAQGEGTVPGFPGRVADSATLPTLV